MGTVFHKVNDAKNLMVEIASGYFYHEPIIGLEKTEWISKIGSSLKRTEASLRGYFMFAMK